MGRRGEGEEWAVGNDGEYQRKSSQMRKNIYFISIDDATLWTNMRIPFCKMFSFAKHFRRPQNRRSRCKQWKRVVMSNNIFKAYNKQLLRNTNIHRKALRKRYETTKILFAKSFLARIARNGDKSSPEM